MAQAQEDSPLFLLLLPPAPSPPDFTALNVAYGDTLLQVLKEASSASQETVGPSVLEIALAIPHLSLQRHAPRTETYAATQKIVAAVYKLICVVAAKEHIDLESSNGVDTRILLVAWSPETTDTTEAATSASGPVIDLQTMAASQRPWQYAFGVESEEGEAFVRAFVAAKQDAAHVHSDTCVHNVSSGPVMSVKPTEESHARPTEASTRKYHHVAVGGTFDHLHIGHKLLLTMTAFAVDDLDQSSQGERSLTVGITGDELLKNKKFSDQLESWHHRTQSVYQFLAALINFEPPGGADERIEQIDEPGPNGHAINITFPSGLVLKCVEIMDPFGPTITDEAISALIISGETRSGGKAVNDKRTEKGWAVLDVMEVDVLDSEEKEVGQKAAESQTDFSGKISSTEIRRALSAKATAAAS
ncbi:hypothetical protein M8818_007181 [Zalaria obscura]|uniref:Uncharacterized protein n=1 Tax=Zalaria obscura TaxID=2024903 RepID=A0ACC3S5A6_9PEZI